MLSYGLGFGRGVQTGSAAVAMAVFRTSGRVLTVQKHVLPFCCSFTQASMVPGALTSGRTPRCHPPGTWVTPLRA